MLSKIKAIGNDYASTSSSRKLTKIFAFPKDDVLTVRSLEDSEADLLRDVFKIIRKFKAGTANKQLFCNLYDFASCICGGIGSFPDSVLFSRWEALKAAQNRQKRKLSQQSDPDVITLITSGPDSSRSTVPQSAESLPTCAENHSNKSASTPQTARLRHSYQFTNPLRQT